MGSFIGTNVCPIDITHVYVLAICSEPMNTIRYYTIPCLFLFQFYSYAEFAEKSSLKVGINKFRVLVPW